jgi:endonuclease YncB( thermonuclease family)
MLAALLICTVVGISDGDTLTARCKTDRAPTTIRVRLAEIDAPERAQAFGQRSRRHLSDICFRRSARIEPVATDSYGRTVAHVSCDRVDAGAEQVRAGMAWVFVRYASKASALYELERDARSARRGLWIDRRPVAPWAWREARR